MYTFIYKYSIQAQYIQKKKSSIQSNFYVNVTFLIHAELKTYAKFNLASTKHGRLSEIHDFTTCIHIKSNEINIRFYQSKTKKRKIKFPDYHFSNLVWENCSTLLNVELYVNVRIKSVLSSYWNSAELLCGLAVRLGFGRVWFNQAVHKFG